MSKPSHSSNAIDQLRSNDVFPMRFEIGTEMFPFTMLVAEERSFDSHQSDPDVAHVVLEANLSSSTERTAKAGQRLAAVPASGMNRPNMGRVRT